MKKTLLLVSSIVLASTANAGVNGNSDGVEFKVSNNAAEINLTRMIISSDAAINTRFNYSDVERKVFDGGIGVSTTIEQNNTDIMIGASVNGMGQKDENDKRLDLVYGAIELGAFYHLNKEIKLGGNISVSPSSLTFGDAINVIRMDVSGGYNFESFAGAGIKVGYSYTKISGIKDKYVGKDLDNIQYPYISVWFNF